MGLSSQDTHLLDLASAAKMSYIVNSGQGRSRQARQINYAWLEEGKSNQDIARENTLITLKESFLMMVIHIGLIKSFEISILK